MAATNFYKRLQQNIQPESQWVSGNFLIGTLQRLSFQPHSFAASAESYPVQRAKIIPAPTTLSSLGRILKTFQASIPPFFISI